jgi:hypothetical protein
VPADKPRLGAKHKTGSAIEVVTDVGRKAYTMELPIGSVPDKGLGLVLGVAFLLGEKRGLVDGIKDSRIVGGLEDIDALGNLTGSDTIDVLAELGIHAREMVDPLLAVVPLDF